MPVKEYAIADIKKKQPAVVQSLKAGAEKPFYAKEVSSLQASEAEKAGEWRLAVWCEDMVLARKRAKDLNQRACIRPRTQPELPKKDEAGVKQMSETKVEEPADPKAKKFAVKADKEVMDPTAKPRGVERGAAAMAAWLSAGGKEIAGADEPENNIVDLFADLLHYADSKGLDGTDAMRVAQGHFIAETEGEAVTVEGAQEVHETPAGGGLDLYCSLQGCGKDLGDGDTAYSLHPFVDAEDDGYPHYCCREHLEAAVKDGSEARLRADEEADPHARGERGEAVEGTRKPSQAQVRHAIAALKGKSAVKAGFAQQQKTARARAEADRIFKRNQAQVARSGYREDQGQKDVRKFGDDCRAGKFGPLEYHEAGALETDLSERINNL